MSDAEYEFKKLKKIQEAQRKMEEARKSGTQNMFEKAASNQTGEDLGEKEDASSNLRKKRWPKIFGKIFSE
jgi:hypothetical protein